MKKGTKARYSDGGSSALPDGFDLPYGYHGFGYYITPNGIVGYRFSRDKGDEFVSFEMVYNGLVYERRQNVPLWDTSNKLTIEIKQFVADVIAKAQGNANGTNGIGKQPVFPGGGD